MCRSAGPATIIGMSLHLRQRFWVELALALVSIVLLIMTLLWTDWIELAFGIDPDAGSGAVEWAIVGLTIVLTLTFSALARSEWRRAAAVPASL
jgi:hypothetical protein